MNVPHRAADSLTIAICTHNRPRQLRGVLRSVTDQVRGSAIQTLIVNNGKLSEEVAEIVRSEAINFRLVTESTVGLSHARNRALHLSTTRYVAFLDDDVLLHAGWLDAARNAIESFPGSLAFGGRVVLGFPFKPPNWLTSHCRVFLGELDIGPAPLLLSEATIFGCNMIIAREPALQLGAFRSDLGHRGASLGGGEETDLVRRLMERGPCWWLPEAAVTHVVDPSRMTYGYMYRRMVAHGQAIRAMDEAPTKGSWASTLAHVFWRGKRTFARDVVKVGLRGALLSESFRLARNGVRLF